MSNTVHCTVCPGDVWIPLDTVLDHMELEHRDRLHPDADRFVVIDMTGVDDEWVDSEQTVEE